MSDDNKPHSFDKTFDDLGVDHEVAGGGFKEDPNVAKEKALVDPNATEPEKQIVKGQNGGKRPGAGRPKGSKNQFSKHSVERLKELNFDPMLAMIELYHETSQIIAEMDDKSHPRRYSAPAMASLLINKQKIVNDLMRYGYRYVPEKIEVETEEKKPFQISLTGIKKDDIEEAEVIEVKTPKVEYKEVSDVKDEASEDKGAED